jgi:hypothetical protein
MNNEDNTLKTASIYKTIDTMTTRKPSSLEEVVAIAVDPELKGILFGRLPVLEVNDPSFSPMDDIEGGVPAKRFMLNYRRKTYYVNTEGYTYCRYLCEIV